MTDCIYRSMICFDTYDQCKECKTCEFNPDNETFDVNMIDFDGFTFDKKPDKRNILEKWLEEAEKWDLMDFL